MTECEKDLDLILEAWTQLVTATNVPGVTQKAIDAAYAEFDKAMEDMAMKNGHPPGKPRRRP